MPIPGMEIEVDEEDDLVKVEFDFDAVFVAPQASQTSRARAF